MAYATRTHLEHMILDADTAVAEYAAVMLLQNMLLQNMLQIMSLYKKLTIDDPRHAGWR